jgi:uncharacterized membrane protein YkoI
MRSLTLKICRRTLAAAGMTLFLVAPVAAKETVINEADVPKPVTATIVRQYPAAKVDKFELEEEHGKRLYEATFRDGNRDIEVKLTAQGELVEEEEVIAEKDLPESVRKSFTGSKYGKSKISKIERVLDLTKKDKKDQPTFDIKISDGGKTIELRYDATGKLLGKE